MDKKLRDLLVRATEKTEAGQLKWQAFTDESFRTAIGSGYLHINRGSTQIENDDGEAYPKITFSAQVTDAQGRVVAETAASQGFTGEDSSVLAELFAVARKDALKTDSVLEKMLDALSGDL